MESLYAGTLFALSCAGGGLDEIRYTLTIERQVPMKKLRRKKFEVKSYCKVTCPGQTTCFLWKQIWKVKAS